LVAQSISNATNDRGVAIANIDEVIKDPNVIKKIPKEAFAAAKEAGYKPPDILSNLLAGSGSKRPKSKKGEGLFLPGTRASRSKGEGLRLPGRGLSGSGIAYV
jgi:hypothetical protein